MFFDKYFLGTHHDATFHKKNQKIQKSPKSHRTHKNTLFGWKNKIKKITKNQQKSKNTYKNIIKL